MTRTIPRVHVVIVNYKTARLCLDAVRSLVAERDAVGDLSVTVVDGASGDGSAAALADAIEREGWCGWVELVALDENLGFAGANDAAIAPLLERAERPDYVHLLNPDTYVRPGAVRALVEHLERNPRVGIAGSRLEDPDGTPQQSAFRFPSLASELENALQFRLSTWLLARWAVARPIPDGVAATDWLSGASMMVRRAVLEEVGLLDDGYFLYYEETDFCLRARRAGWSCAYVPASRVVHLIAQATGIDTQIERRRPAYWFDSRRRYFRKNHGLAYAAAADVLRIAGAVSAEARRRLLGRPSRNPPHLIEDFVRHSVLLRWD
jgi:N-acetylglucosaminyl-diphospho-decaprenol L-rhamnosyltransferase